MSAAVPTQPHAFYYLFIILLSNVSDILILTCVIVGKVRLEWMIVRGVDLK